MELDTDAPCGIVSKETLYAIKLNCKLLKTDKCFASYTEHHISCIGCIPVEVSTGATSRKLDFYVVDGNLIHYLAGNGSLNLFTRSSSTNFLMRRIVST